VPKVARSKVHSLGSFTGSHLFHGSPKPHDWTDKAVTEFQGVEQEDWQQKQGYKQERNLFIERPVPALRPRLVGETESKNDEVQ
jgi:hypothetical protein